MRININLKLVGLTINESSGFSISLPNSANFSLPNTFLSEISIFSQNIAFSLSFIDQSTTSSSNSIPTLLGITLFSLEDYSIIPVHLESPIKINIPLYNGKSIKTPGCFF